MFRHVDTSPAALVTRATPVTRKFRAPRATPVTPAKPASCAAQDANAAPLSGGAQDLRAAPVTRTAQAANATRMTHAVQETRAAPVAGVPRRVGAAAARSHAAVASVANVPRSAAPSEVKTQRKLLDQKRMAYRRAIEDFAEQRRLQRDLAVFPDCTDLLVELLADQQVNAA
jgi:hypothetical protein